MGKGNVMLRSPAIPHRQRSNQDDEGDGSSNNSSNSSSTTKRKTMQCSTSAFAAPHDEAATLSSDATASLEAQVERSKSVIVLRRCEDVNVRTGGFQKIKEAAHRLDIRRPRQQHQHMKESPAKDQLPKEPGLRKEGKLEQTIYTNYT